MSSFCLLSCELFRDNLEIPPHDYRRFPFDEAKTIAGHRNYAIATLKLIFNSGVCRNLHLNLALRLCLLEYRAFRTKDGSRQWADLCNLDSVEGRARERERRQAHAAVVQSRTRQRIE